MWRLAFILIILLAFTPNVGAVHMICAPSSGGGGASEYCTSCTGTSDADILCEDWESTEECTWTSAVAGTNTVDTDAALPTGIGSCSDEGTESALITFDDPGNAGHIYADPRGANVDTWYVRGWIYVIADGMGNNNSTRILECDDSTTFSTQEWNISLKQTDVTPTYVLVLTYFDAGSAWDADAVSESFGQNTWVEFDAKIEPGSVGRIRINAGTYGDGTDNVGTARHGRYLGVGPDAGSYSCTLYLESLKIDDDTTPNTCN